MAYDVPVPDRTRWDDATVAYVAALEATNSLLRATLETVVKIAEREADVKLPKRVDAMTEDEFAIFAAITRTHGALLYIGQRAARDLEHVADVDAEMVFNINDLFLFRTTEAGTDFLLRHAEETRATVRASLNGDPNGIVTDTAYIPHRDGSGLWEMQAWEFFATFGPQCYNGAQQLIENNRILVRGMT